jgi:hypothetical protein
MNNPASMPIIIQATTTSTRASYPKSLSSIYNKNIE